LTDKIVLAYSGGLDTSVAVRWLADNHNAEIIALMVDVGQEFDRDLVIARARKSGASDVVIVDAKEEFARDYVIPALQAGALYEGRYPLATALARPLIAKHLVEVAKAHGANAVAHGCTGKGNDQVRFETAVAGLAPDLLVHAPVRDWGMTREQEIAYAQEHDIEIPVKSGAAYSFDENLWGRSIEAGPLEDPWIAPTEDPYSLTVAPSADKEAQEVTISFENGVPVTIDNQRLDLVSLIAKAAEIAGSHGVGRIDMVEPGRHQEQGGIRSTRRRVAHDRVSRCRGTRQRS
jgi:argininosuccinate synthase